MAQSLHRFVSLRREKRINQYNRIILNLFETARVIYLMGEKKKTGLDFLFLNLLIYHPKDKKKKMYLSVMC